MVIIIKLNQVNFSTKHKKKKISNNVHVKENKIKNNNNHHFLLLNFPNYLLQHAKLYSLSIFSFISITEIALQPFGPSQNGAVTYRMLGGVLDFFITLGPKPLSVISQYSEIVGRTYFPPFWSLGFHICKYGISNSTVLRDIIQRNRDTQMPYVCTMSTFLVIYYLNIYHF